MLGNVRGIEARKTSRQTRPHEAAVTSWRLLEKLSEVSEIASANMQFRRQNPHQRQARPLPPAETSEELFPHMLQGGLHTINGGNWQGITSYYAAKVSRCELRRQ